MNRYGIPTAPEGCGTDPATGACYSCTVRALRVGRRFVRQLLPFKRSTYYFTGGENDSEFVNIDFWRMWFGRVFAHEHHAWPIAH